MIKKSQKGFSLLEGILVLSIGVAIGVSAFALHNNRMRSIEVDTTYGQITKVVGNMSKVAGVLSDYGLLTQTNALRKILPEAMFDEEGKIQTSFGQVLVAPFTAETLNDSYSVTYENIPKNICAPVVSKSFDMFSKVYIAGQLVYDRAENNELDMARVGTLCETSGAIAVGFISERIPPKTGTGIALSTLLNAGNRLNPNALSTAGANLDALDGIFGTAAADAATGANTQDAVYRAMNLNGTTGTTFSGTTPTTGTYTPPGNAACNSAPANWGNGSTSGQCGNTLPGGVNSGSVEQLVNNTPGYEGLASYACNNGLWSPFNAPTNVCYEGGCKAVSVTWGGGCQGSTTLSPSGATVNVSNSRLNYDGSAPFTCNQGEWIAQAGATCTLYPQCGSADGQTFLDSNSPASSDRCGVGATVNYTTTSTGWSWECQGSGSPSMPPNDSCTSVSVCSATTTTSGSCSFNIPTVNSGSSETVSDVTVGYSGSITVSCANGVRSYSGASCTQDPPPPLCGSQINIKTVQSSYYEDSYKKSASCWGYDVPSGSLGQNITVTPKVRGFWFTTTGNVAPSPVPCGTTDATTGIVSVGATPPSVNYTCNASGSWVEGTTPPSTTYAWVQVCSNCANSSITTSCSAYAATAGGSCLMPGNTCYVTSSSFGPVLECQAQ